eukprot:gene1431-1555_t
MEKEKRIVFGSNGTERTYTSCYTSDESSSKGPFLKIPSRKSPFLVNAGEDDIHMIFQAKALSTVAQDHLVLPLRAMSALGYSDGNCLCSSIVVSLQEAGNCPYQQLSLKYLGYYSHRHWDECSLESMDYLLPCKWNKAWPRKLSLPSFSSMLPSMLTGHVFQRKGSLILLKVMSVDMAFLLEAEENVLGEKSDSKCDSQCYRFSSSMKIRVDFTASDNNKNIDNDSKHSSGERGLFFVRSFKDMDFSSKAWNRVIDHITCNREVSHILAHSLFLSGSPGSGKSSFLQALTSLSLDQCEVLFGTLLKISSLPSLRFIEEEYPPWIVSLHVLLNTLFHRSLDISTLKQFLEEKERLILLLDDMDSIFSLFMEVKTTTDEADDALAALGNNPGGIEHEDERRIVAYHLYILLSHVSSCHRSSSDKEGNQYLLQKVWVVGAGRLENSEVPRDRQCPNFDLFIYLQKPSQQDREYLLSTFLLDLPIVEKDKHVVWAGHLAGLTRGYTPSDLHAMLQKSQLISMGVEGGGGEIQWQHILQAIASYQIYSLRKLEVSLHRDLSQQAMGWGSLGGCDAAIQQCQRALRPLLSSTQSKTNKALQVQLPRGMVLYGPSGCGKTLFGRALAQELRMNLLSVRSTDVLSKYFGQTEARLREIFHAARRASPCLLFFDDFDALAHKRGMQEGSTESSHGSVQNRILSTFLNELDGVFSASNKMNEKEDIVFVLIACKELDNLDEALIRPGRLHEHVHLGYPSLGDFLSILSLYMQRLPCQEGLSVQTIESRLQQSCQSFFAKPFTGATAEAICSRAQFLALEECVNSKMKGEERVDSEYVVTNNHFVAAIDEFYPLPKEERPEQPPSSFNISSPLSPSPLSGVEWKFNLTL